MKMIRLQLVDGKGFALVNVDSIVAVVPRFNDRDEEHYSDESEEGVWTWTDVHVATGHVFRSGESLEAIEESIMSKPSIVAGSKA